MVQPSHSPKKQSYEKLEVGNKEKHQIKQRLIWHCPNGSCQIPSHVGSTILDKKKRVKKKAKKKMKDNHREIQGSLTKGTDKLYYLE